jgi:hypothetical protein
LAKTKSSVEIRREVYVDMLLQSLGAGGIHRPYT